MENRLLALVEPFLLEHGFRVVDVDCRTYGKGLVRLFIEKATEDSACATLDECAKVSRLVDPLLDSSDLFTGAFDLEVSTPGLDRRLRFQSDFERIVGNELKLDLAGRVEGLGKSARGHLLKVEPEGILVKVSGKEVQVPYGAISRANMIWTNKENNGFRTR